MISAVAIASMFLIGVAPTAYRLNAAADVWDVTVEDLDLNGHKDVVALCSDEKSYSPEKFVGVYLATDSGAYPSRATLTLALAPETGALFWAEIDGEPPRELVITDGTGATYYTFDGGEFRVLGEARFNSILPTGSRKPKFLKNAAMDLDGDGIDEWIIPVKSGHEIRRADGLVVHVKSNTVSEVLRFGIEVVSHRLPSVHSFELPGQPVKGIVFLSREFADFSYGPLWSEHLRYPVPLELDREWDASVSMKDVNNDGFPDLLITQSRGAISVDVTAKVYVASEPFHYPAEPTASFETTGAFAAPLLVDVDGDKKLDMIFVSMPLGVKAILNYFFRKKVSMRADVYMYSDGVFSQVPTSHRTITVDAPEDREQIAFSSADFTGDGLLDVAYGVKEDRFSFYAGNANTLFDAKPMASLDIPAFGVAEDYNLNDNGRADIIIYHPNGKARKRIEVIVF